MYPLYESNLAFELRRRPRRLLPAKLHFDCAPGESPGDEAVPQPSLVSFAVPAFANREPAPVIRTTYAPDRVWRC
jgi:hypothetical protein